MPPDRPSTVATAISARTDDPNVGLRFEDEEWAWSQIVTEMALQGRHVLGEQSPFEKDAKLQREAFNARMSYDELIKNDYATMMTAFHAQWKTFGEVVANIDAPSRLASQS